MVINLKRVSTKKNTTVPKANSNKKYELLGIAFFTIGLFSLIGLLGLNVGFVGSFFAKVLLYMFGVGAYIIPVVVMLIGLQYI